ncbi:CocE/NonD family hydrolase [Roseateles sp. P5_E7]
MKALKPLRCVVLAVVFAAANAAAQPAPFGQYRPAPAYAETVTTSLYLPMRDGVRLAVSISRPAQGGRAVDGRFPVIWQHTLGISGPGADGGPVGDTPRGYRELGTLVRQGYVVVQVARRGHGPSFGKRRGYNDRTEAYDAYEVIDWLAAQPWSTGDIGVYGCSNTGDAAMHAVTAAHPRLKAAWAGCFSWEKYDGFLRGGIFANWGTGPERTVAEDLANTPVQGDESKVLLHQAAQEHQGATVLRKMWEGMPYRDDDAEGVGSRFWYEGSVASYLPQLRASGTAVYVQGGWRDDLRGQGLLAWANLSGARLVVGPWGHCENGDFDLLSEMQRFFDQHLKRLDTGLPGLDPVHYFTVNAPAGQAWKSARRWPVPGSTPVRFFLAGGELAAQPPARASSVSFEVRHDIDCPAMPRPANGLMTGWPPCPQENAGPRFITAPLATDTEVTGDAVADLWISSTTSDANVFVYLEDVAPDGRVQQVTDARLKASLRQPAKPAYENFGLPYQRAHREDAQPLKPGETVQMRFAFLPISHLFKAGHRLRVSVAGADYRERNLKPVVPAPVLTILSKSSVTLPIVRPAVPADTTQGKLPDGTPYRIDVPLRWNGTVLVGLDYAGRDPMAPDDGETTNRALMAAGYALAGTTRTITGWAIHKSAENAVRTLDLFEARYGKPRHAVQFGSSQGGHTAAVSVQAYPSRWSGALAQCAGLAGSIGQWHAKSDALFAAKALLAPGSDLPVVGIPKDWRTTALPAWQSVLAEARQTPQGRARVALAAMLGQLPDWADAAVPPPRRDDLNAREAGLGDSLALAPPRGLIGQAMSSRSQIEALAGGNITANVGVDYARVLRVADVDGLVARLYQRAGLDLAADLGRLARAPRVVADPQAVAYMATGVFDGRLQVPVLTLSGIGDAISGIAAQQAYESVVQAAGKSALLRQTYVESAGHCGFKPAETVAAVQTLMRRIETGAWPRTDAAAMNQAAAATGLGDSRFIVFVPPPFARPFTACDLQATGADPVHAEGQALPVCRALKRGKQ